MAGDRLIGKPRYDDAANARKTTTRKWMLYARPELRVPTFCQRVSTDGRNADVLPTSRTQESRGVFLAGSRG